MSDTPNKRPVFTTMLGAHLSAMLRATMVTAKPEPPARQRLLMRVASDGITNPVFAPKKSDQLKARRFRAMREHTRKGTLR